LEGGRRLEVRIGVDDGLQLSFEAAVAAIAVGVVATHEPLVGAAHLAGGGGIAEAERRERPGIAGAGPAPRRRRPGIAGEKIERIAEAERLAALPAGGGAFPAGERRLRFADLVGAQPVEIIVAGVEFADMVEAEELPAALAAGKAVGARRAEFARQRAAGVVAGRRIRAVDAAMEPLGAARRIGRVGRNRWVLGEACRCRL